MGKSSSDRRIAIGRADRNEDREKGDLGRQPLSSSSVKQYSTLTPKGCPHPPYFTWSEIGTERNGSGKLYPKSERLAAPELLAPPHPGRGDLPVFSRDTGVGERIDFGGLWPAPQAGSAGEHAATRLVSWRSYDRLDR